MFSHIIFYRLKINFRSKDTIFWLLVFPIILATLFRFTLGNIGAAGNFQPIDVAVVIESDTSEAASLVSTIKELSEGEDRLFNAQILDKYTALGLLRNGDADGVILISHEKELIVSSSGIEQSIIKAFLDQYMQSLSAVERISISRPEAMGKVIEELSEYEGFTENAPIGRANPDIALIYFYSLLAMSSFFGGFLGLYEVNAIQANLSMQAVRVCVAPVHKLKLFVYNFAVACFVQFLILMTLLSYLVFVLSIEFGNRLPLIILTIFISTLTGVSFGSFIASVIKASEGVKTGILIGLSNIGSMLAGMMSAEIKYIVTSNVPILAFINPVNLVSDAFYSLYFFDTYDRFARNLAGLIVFALIFCIATYFVIRRQKYASI